ncbi:hypothetical protein C8R45DRAFT_960619 [Mycena sanguinolenta]|nr:hypothetical protein C8R45DRAFT_960619 [Mycena sanguinolenta]
MPTVFRGPRSSKQTKIVKIYGGIGGSGGRGGVIGGDGGMGEGPRVRIGVARTVTNINKNYSTPPQVPSGFRTIPLGDIDLQREIQLDSDSGIVSLRRLYSAKIEGSDATRTVAMYEGDAAELEWRRDTKRYMAIRHSNIVQLYATASFGNIHAAIFHDDFIPLQDFLDIYEGSHLSTVYIRVHTDIGLRAVNEYYRSIFGGMLQSPNCTFFIRRSTGRFCVDLVIPGGQIYLPEFELGSMPTQRGLEFLEEEDSETTIIHSLTLNQYHLVALESSDIHSISISPSATVNICSVVDCPTFHDLLEIAWLPNAELSSPRGWDSKKWGVGELMPDGWTRIVLDDAVNGEFSVAWRLEKNDFWLSQAHHIFSTLQITSNFEDYVVLERIRFTLTVSAVEGPTSTGFLFLCPPKHFQTGETSFKWPDCPAYWSLDASGAKRLTSADAINFGFPSYSISTHIRGLSWDASDYVELRHFHKGKGFDPDSQDLARHLGYELYQVADQLTVPFAHIDDEDSPHFSDAEDTDHDDVAAGSRHPEVPVSSPFVEIVDLTGIDRDAEEVPLSRRLKFVLNVQLSLIMFLALSWVLGIFHESLLM